MLTQRDKLIKRLRKGWCSGVEALFSCGSMKLATRVGELRRDGYVIADKWCEQDGKRWKSYVLLKAPK